MMTNINKHDCFQNHIIIIRPERRSFHKCGAQMGFLQLPAASQTSAMVTMMTLDPCMGVTPCPSWEAPCVANIIFGCGCERGFHSSTFNFTLHFSAHSLAFGENAFCYRVMDHGAPPPLGSPVAVIVILG